MFARPEALNPEKHREVAYAGIPDYRFADDILTIPLLSGELSLAVGEYVILFEHNKPMTVALLGVQKGRNAYVSDKGVWNARYIPASIRAYPFSAVSSGAATEDAQHHSFTLVIDTQAPHLNAPNGERLFDDEGGQTGLLERIKGIMTNLQRDALLTARLVQQIDDAGLLVPRRIIAKNSGVALEGFRAVDVDALARLPANELAELRSSGALMMVYLHMASQINLNAGVIGQVGQVEGKKPMAASVFSLFDDDGDIQISH